MNAQTRPPAVVFERRPRGTTGKTFDECKRAIELRLYTGKLF